MATVNIFTKQKDSLEPNDGARSYASYINSCYDRTAPFNSNEQTRLKITHHRHDIVDFSKSFITFEFEAVFQIENGVKKSKDDKGTQNPNVNYAPATQYFVGWKNASDILQTLQIENSNIDCDYLQRECTRESMCMNCIKPNEVKVKNKYSHTLYEEARCGKEGICGQYIKYTDTINANDQKTLNFTVILPILDITCLQAFTDFPTMLGDIVLKFTINKDSMVWCQCDPYETTKTYLLKNIEQFEDKGVNSVYENVGYERRFVQIGQEARCITNYEDYDLQVGPQRISVKSLVCKRCTCDVYGYNIQPNIKQEIYNVFNETQYIPAQQLDVVNFIEAYRGGGYQSNISQQIHNVTKFVVVFPEKGSQTCYRNPMVRNLQFICDGIGYPHTPFDNTYDARFYTTMMRAGDQENFFEAENDYRNSVYRRRKPEYVNSLSDITSFLITFQAERNCNGYYYDGIETDHSKVSIELKFASSDLDTYSESPQKPQVWFIRDTYWTLDNKNGLKYHKSGSPPNS